ncbi:hypothetical protein L3L93_004389 [Salmonella enterica]|nr:hypothetical protein [Salmonella enterica]
MLTIRKTPGVSWQNAVLRRLLLIFPFIPSRCFIFLLLTMRHLIFQCHTTLISGTAHLLSAASFFQRFVFRIAETGDHFSLLNIRIKDTMFMEKYSKPGILFFQP